MEAVNLQWIEICGLALWTLTALVFLLVGYRMGRTGQTTAPLITLPPFMTEIKEKEPEQEFEDPWEAALHEERTGREPTMEG